MSETRFHGARVTESTDLVTAIIRPQKYHV